MTSLVPGILPKLLEHMITDGEVSGEYPPSLLQVVGIVPLLACDELFPKNGFYLKVSDSSHATYVSLSDEDNDLVLTDKIQLGQFIYVERMESASPVPILIGVKPVLGRRPCVGNPEDVAPTFPLRSLHAFHDANLCSKVAVKTLRTDNENKNLFPRVKCLKPTLDLNLNTGVKKESAVKSMSPNLKSIHASQMSCCSLPTSFQRFGNGVKKQAEMKKMEKTTPTSKNSVVKAGSSANKDPRRRVSDGRFQSKEDNTFHIYTKSVEEDGNVQSPMIKSIKIETLTDQKRLKSRRISRRKKLQGESSDNGFRNMVQVSVNGRRFTEGSIAWNSLPSSLANLGKEVMKHRDAAQLTAIHALQEASIAENLLHCLSVHADLASSEKVDNPQHTVEEFLNLQTNLNNAHKIASSLSRTSARSSPVAVDSVGRRSEETANITSERHKHAASWVQAALSTNLSSFPLFSRETASAYNKHRPNLGDVAKSHRAPKVQRKRHGNIASKLAPTTGASRKRCNGKAITVVPVQHGAEWSRGTSLKESVEMAALLRVISIDWFFNFLHRFFSDGLTGSCLLENGRVIGMLGWLKCVNDWFDEIETSNQESHRVDELRKKIYQFIMTHVESPI